jgi:hypothetical protein
MQRIENLAELSIARACGFAALSIVCIMLGCSPNPALALKVGGMMTLASASVLAFRGHTALQRPYMRTELWTILPRHERPRVDVAQQIIGGVLKRVYLRFARQAAMLAVLLLAAALIAGMAGLDRFM